MFWRDDPRKDVTRVPQVGGNDWPRNGAILNGQVHQLPNMKHLQVDSWKQAKSKEWIINCQGLWMPFEQGGLLLHKVTKTTTTKN